jgi:anhydro-N-acetylmuramic acid kinase
VNQENSAVYVGVMSGTSIDAVDVAVVDFSAAAPTLVGAASFPWPGALHARLSGFAAGDLLDAAHTATLDVETGRFLAECVNEVLGKIGLTAQQVAAIGCHGQTVAHLPDDSNATTLQLGDGNTIAELTGIATVNDFRRRDMAAGGQGAPLAPAFHASVLGSSGEDRVILNLGGIANITLLHGDRRPATGFDTGPANCLMDLWTRRHQGTDFDRGGAWAASGQLDQPLLDRLLSDPYFKRTAPKSTGTQYFSSAWLDHFLEDGERSPADVQATLLALTRDTVTLAVRQYAPTASRLLVCGGGVHNSVLMQRLQQSLGIAVQSTAEFGVAPEWMEAMAFAWLARRTLAGMAGNLPTVTGATGERILGAIHPA